MCPRPLSPVCPQSVYQLLPPPYRDIWLEWLDSEKSAAREQQDKKDKVGACLTNQTAKPASQTVIMYHLKKQNVMRWYYIVFLVVYVENNIPGITLMKETLL